jgi:hypothetical protein
LALVFTLFEHDHHLGAGALINSLVRCGFSGTIIAGYKGTLPFWTTSLKQAQRERSFHVSPGVDLMMIHLDNVRYLVSHRAHFILDMQGLFPDESHIFYFDPDIVIRTRWSFFEEWVERGVALCEDLTSPMSNTHPLKLAWKEYFQRRGFAADVANDVYINSGFVGVIRQNLEFFNIWRNMIDQALNEIGDSPPLFVTGDRSYIFYHPDQDTLNCAIMCWRGPVSIMGREGMDFTYGGFTMSHAIGTPKPWNASFLKELIIRGKKPSIAARRYWQFTQDPICLYETKQVRRKRLNLGLASALGRLLGA